MCAETLPFRCHRSFVADALVACGDAVFDVLAPGRVERHRLHPEATVEAGRLCYGGELAFACPAQSEPLARA
jgi:hypothetical protein